ncbi:hypothetical protein C455_10828 [Haloferax larsenii JCM 13917]|nr:hypothetical protein [Haloferax larsenii]ELZ78171.1 hypothetical protein C455_10828 [Haloferax larsenii JCM 13917]
MKWWLASKEDASGPLSGVDASRSTNTGARPTPTCQKVIVLPDETVAVLALVNPTARTVRRLVFGLLTVLLGAMTIWSFLRGQAGIRVVLLASLTAYAGSNLFSQQIPHISRIAAVPLGVIGVGAYILGAPTDLPILLILLGVGSVVDLIWDPTGNVYGSDSK